MLYTVLHRPPEARPERRRGLASGTMKRISAGMVAVVRTGPALPQEGRHGAEHVSAVGPVRRTAVQKLAVSKAPHDGEEPPRTSQR